MVKFLNRLIEEWKTHGKLVIGVDFDDTIYPYKSATQEECDEIIRVIKEAQEVGCYVVINTARKKEKYHEVYDYCKLKELIIDGINITPINVPYGNENKIYANLFIDDRGGLNESVLYLKTAILEIKRWRNENEK